MRGRRQRGQAVIESALSLGVFVLCVMGVTDLGRAGYTYNALSNLAREGSHYTMLEFASDSSSPCYWNQYDAGACLAAVKSYILALKMAPGLSASNVSVALTVPCGNGTTCSAGLPVSVALSMEFQPVATSLLKIGPFAISANSTDVFVVPVGTSTPVAATPSPTPSGTATPQPTPTVVPEGPPSNVVVSPDSRCTSNCQAFDISWSPPANMTGLAHYDIAFGAAGNYQYGDPVPSQQYGSPVTTTTVDTGNKRQSVCFNVYSVFADGLSWYATGSWNASGTAAPTC